MLNFGPISGPRIQGSQNSQISAQVRYRLHKTLKALFIILACICANVIYRELDCEVQISNTLSQRRFTPHSRVSNLNDFLKLSLNNLCNCKNC